MIPTSIATPSFARLRSPDGTAYYALACGRRGGSHLHRFTLSSDCLALTAVTCVDPDYPVSQMSPVPFPGGKGSALLLASVEGVISCWYDTETAVVPFLGNVDDPISKGEKA